MTTGLHARPLQDVSFRSTASAIFTGPSDGKGDPQALFGQEQRLDCNILRSFSEVLDFGPALSSHQAS